MLSGGDGRFTSVNAPKQNIMNKRAKSCELPTLEWACPEVLVEVVVTEGDKDVFLDGELSVGV